MKRHIIKISWSTDDFVIRAKEVFDNNRFKSWEEQYDESQFAGALDLIAKNHDANDGINWFTIDYYLNEMCLK
ncbi:MAG: hypothetical protein PHT07_22475 [Paludibacter sp.]|nr:hypothetical protein [Paludibacter sp.]